MLDDINAYFASRGYYHLTAHAGADLETEYSTATIARQWVDQFSYAGIWRVYDFGDATCPTSGDGTVDNHCDTSQGSWLESDIWYLSWGNPSAFPFPEIYSHANALQWYQISLFGLRSENNRPLIFWGTLTEQLACSQTGNQQG